MKNSIDNTIKKTIKKNKKSQTSQITQTIAVSKISENLNALELRNIAIEEKLSNILSYLKEAHHQINKHNTALMTFDDEATDLKESLECEKKRCDKKLAEMTHSISKISNAFNTLNKTFK